MPGPEMPYSVSMPMTLAMATCARPPLCDAGSLRALYPAGYRLQVLARGDPLHLPAVAVSIAQEGTDVDDPLALLPGDPRPVVGVGGVGGVLVFLGLVADGRQEVLQLESFLPLRQESFDHNLLGPTDDVFDHRSGVEVLEVQDLLVARLVGDL